jgi:RNA polymerase sigma-70 factor (ECF subfamily)
MRFDRNVESKAELDGFTEFARDIEPRLRYALAGRLPPDRARDATQDALIYAWRHWDEVRSMSNPGGYLYVVAKRRGWRTHRQAAQLSEIGTTDPPPIEPGLATALERLSTMQRQVVYLVEGLGISQHETAELLGVSRTTVQTHLERALHHLRLELGVSIDE